MNQESRQLINLWINRAEAQTDPFIKFFILYMCLDAWVTSASSLDTDSERLAWLLNTDNLLRSCWQDLTGKKEYLGVLKAIGSVEDMRPGHRGKYVNLHDTNSLEQVLKFIYQVRCNLFHGGKSPTNRHDKLLVEASAGYFLYGSMLRWIVTECHPEYGVNNVIKAIPTPVNLSGSLEASMLNYN